MASEIEKNQEVQDAMNVILRELNYMGRDRHEAIIATILECLRREHRTIQQKFWDAILKTQIQYAEFGHDLRNEAAVKLAGVVKEAATKNKFDYGLPCI